MRVTRTVLDTREALGAASGKLGLVPTMGFLHAGHMALVEAAKAKADVVAASLFVNPSQFGEAADLDAYPRDEARDLEMFAAAGVDLVFVPSVEEIYPASDETIVETIRMANMLHGLVRPGHFRGVTTVLARLFNIFQPDLACFGEKDYQQLQVIKRMVQDLHFPIEIVGVPTVREADGLAMSSRNVRLDPEERRAALCLSQALDAAETATDIAALETILRDSIGAEPRAELRGLDIVEATSLQPTSGPITSPVAVMLSVEVGHVLLIDQRVYGPREGLSKG
ncbi:MAG: pantoate--beta-alanine ligase [Pseudomonadota bacterium]